jgi:cytochrome c oxidase subunit III
MTAAVADPSPRLAPNGVVGMLIFLSTEVMLFAGMVSAYLILKAGTGVWPPEGQPRLPLEVTFANTLVLLASGVAMWSAVKTARQGTPEQLERRLAIAGLLGLLFLAVQGFEWMRLLQHGLSIRRGLYGATFMTVIGTHATHVLCGVLGILLVLRRAGARQYSAAEHTDVLVCGLFWGFVVAVWPVLYVLVYLA